MLLLNNTWGIKHSRKIIKLFEYLQKNATPACILQEMQSPEEDEIRQNDEFKRQFFLSHTTTSYGVAIGFLGTKSFKVENIR